MFTFSASSSAQIAQQSITVNAVAGALTANAVLQLKVSGAVVLDSFHKVGGTIIHGFYDESRQLLFATNLGLNELDVISSQDFSIKARVPVPQPVGIDQMADGKTLVLGTASQQIVTVDEDTLMVTQHPFAAVGKFCLVAVLSQCCSYGERQGSNHRSRAGSRFRQHSGCGGIFVRMGLDCK
jgi:hypothetical protein